MPNRNTKYLPEKFSLGESSTDGHTNDAETYVEVYHLLSNRAVRFKAFITEFSDDHQSTWTDEPVYGRMDDISTFQSTKRMISIAFDVPSYDVEEAVQNLQKITLLKQFLYPSYSQTGNALAISSSPLVRLKFVNFIRDASTFDNGLLGKIKNINFAPDLDAGFHLVEPSDKLLKILSTDLFELSNKRPINTYFVPKLFKINISGFNVIHEHATGWLKKENVSETDQPGYDPTKGGGKTTEYYFGVKNDGITDLSYYPYGFSNNGGGNTDNAIFSSQETANDVAQTRILEGE
jgi:hypothetical protein